MKRQLLYTMLLSNYIYQTNLFPILLDTKICTTIELLDAHIPVAIQYCAINFVSPYLISRVTVASKLASASC